MEGRYWAAKCKNPECGKPSAVRPSASTGYRIEILKPTEVNRVQCPHCNFVNEFTPLDMYEVDAKILNPNP